MPVCVNANGRQSDAGSAPGFAAQIQPIFDFHCSSCHTAVHDVDYTLAPGKSYAALVNRPTSAACDANTLRVKPGDSAHSMLWLKITDDPARCLSSMPYFQPGGLIAICPADVAQIGAWITEGAPDN